MKSLKFGVALTALLLLSCVSKREENPYLIIDFKGETVPVMYNGSSKGVEIYNKGTYSSGYYYSKQTSNGGNITYVNVVKGGIADPLKQQIFEVMRRDTESLFLTNISNYVYFSETPFGGNIESKETVSVTTELGAR